jgi:ABC-type multidrug transport system ATPase subunit
VLAKWLLTRPRLLLLDEPTRGVDIGAKREIYRLIGELAAGGMAIVVASSELPELMAIADRIAVLCGGRLTGELAREAFSEEALLKAALPDEGRQVANAAAKQAALQMPLNGEAPQRATVLHAGGLPSSAPSKEGMRDPNPIDRDS